MSAFWDWTGAILLVIGVAFMVLAAVGVVRMPDIYMRLQSASKASTLGLGSLLAAVAIHFGDLATVFHAIALVAFTFLTVPVGVHALALAAHRMNVEKWSYTHKDELTEHETSPPEQEA